MSTTPAQGICMVRYGQCHRSRATRTACRGGRRLLRAGIVLLLLVHRLCAGWIEDLPDKTVIHVKVFWLPDPARTDTPTRADAAAVKEFIRRFPAIFQTRWKQVYEAHPERYGHHNWNRVEVRLHRATGIRIEGVEGALLAVAGNMAPDVMYVNFRQSDTYIQEGFLYPLDLPADRYLAAMPPEEVEFRVHPKIWRVIRRRGPGGEVHVWALPYGGALGKVVLFRKDVFDEAGVPYPTNDWTWNDMLEACRRITDPEKGIYGIYFSTGPHESWWWMSFLWSAGGEAVRYDPTADVWRAVFDSREAAIALDFYTRLCTEPWEKSGRRYYGYAYQDPDWGTAGAKWERGEIAMLFAYIDERIFQRINPDITGMVPVPRGPTGLRGSELNSMMMGLFSGIREPAVRDAAWEYIRFYDSIEATRIKTRVLVEGGLGRFLNPRLLVKFGYPELVRLSPPGWQDCFRIALEAGRPEPYGKNCNYLYNILTEPIERARQRALEGDLSPDREKRLAQLQSLLASACERANQEMFGLVPPQAMKRRRLAAAALLAAIVLAFAFSLRRIGSRFAAIAAGSPVAAPRKNAARRAAVLMAPAVLSILLWQYVPLFWGSLMAFQDFHLVRAPEWIGLDNFGNLLWDVRWWRALWNSVRYSALIIFLCFLPPLGLALLLNEIPRGKTLFRLLYYLPAVAGGLVTILLWKQLYEPGPRGILNRLVMNIPAIAYLAAGTLVIIYSLRLFRRLRLVGGSAAGFLAAATGLAAGLALLQPGITIIVQSGAPFPAALLRTLSEPVRWLTDPDTALLACALPVAWHHLGPGSLIYLAALKQVSDDYYDAADLDGASSLDKVLFVVVPILRPLLIINFVGIFIAAWVYATANILALTGGAAGTEVAGLYIFYKAFIFLKFGPATAMAWVLAFLLIAFTVYQLRVLAGTRMRAGGS